MCAEKRGERQKGGEGKDEEKGREMGGACGLWIKDKETVSYLNCPNVHRAEIASAKLPIRKPHQPRPTPSTALAPTKKKDLKKTSHLKLYETNPTTSEGNRLRLTSRIQHPPHRSSHIRRFSQDHELEPVVGDEGDVFCWFMSRHCRIFF